MSILGLFKVEYGAALSLIEASQVTSDNAIEVLAAVKARNDLVLSEKRKVVSDRDSIRSELDLLMSEAGIDGDTLRDQIKSLNAKLKTLQTEQAESKSTIASLEAAKVAIEAERTALLAKQTESDRTAHLNQLATKAGANPTVLAQLTKDLELEKMSIVGEEVTIDGKSLREWVEGDAVRSAFAPALFPSGAAPVQSPTFQGVPKFPSGSPVTNSANQIDDVYIKATGRDPSKTDWITKR